MKKLYTILLILSTLLSADTATAKESVVKIFTSVSKANYRYPYQVGRISKYTGSGAIIKGNRVLTSAHVVAGAKFIEIQKENNPKRYIATIKYISHQADLAILELKDNDFFNNTKALQLSQKIKARDEVTVLGYPIGGNTISTTTGVISRIEYVNYIWSAFYLLAIQIDAAINPGNSGGPVIDDNGKLVGIAMMKLSKSSNISYIVPSLIINTFLEDIKDKHVDGFHSDSIYYQHIKNSAQKKLYDLKERTGLIITSVGIDENLLKVDDIILEVDDNDIANNGTIKTQYGRNNFSIIYHTKQLSQSVKLKILRDKKEITLDYPLKKVTHLINWEFSKEPRYIIYGGFVFTPLTRNYLSSINGSSRGLNMLFYQKDKTVDYEEPVVSIDTIFPSEVNRGYYASSYVLISVNGIKIKNFKHLVSLLDNMSDEFTVFEFLEKSKVILNTKEAKESLGDIMKVYNIKSDRRE